MDLSLLVFLILLNGVFAMSEMALTAARKARLQVMVEAGEPGAQAAMDLHDNPTKFLSTVQIGITSIGVLNGIVGEAAFAEPLAAWLASIYPLHERALRIASTALVVVIITFLTIIFGELVPKRLGQMFPETVARLVAQPMNWLSAATRPFVLLLGACTNAILRLLGAHRGPSRSVTEEEIAAQLEEGVDAGVIEAQEHQMVRNVFRLDDRQIGSMMIPRAEIAWLDVAAPMSDVLAAMAAHGHSRYPVCRGGLDDVLGVLAAHRLIEPMARGQVVSLADHIVPPVFVPETLSGMELLEHFRGSDAELVFVVDEYGSVQGVITERDLLEAITGEFAAPASEEAWAIRRDDGSWLIDGLIPVPELKDRLALRELPEEDRGRYNTLAGMIMLLLGDLPKTTDTVDWEGWRFEVVDLDGKRVDKVLVTRLPADEEEGRPRVINPALYKNAVVLDSAQHSNYKLARPMDDWSVAAGVNAIFVASVEFGDVCLEYPILFVQAGTDPAGKPQVAPIAVFGLANNENLFVEGSTWRAQYLPAMLRSYPFGLGRVAEDKVMVVIDDNWPGWAKDAGAQGQALFDDGKQPSDYMKNVRDQLEKIETETQRTRLFGNALLDAGLLTDMRFEATLPDGQKLTVDGFLTVDEKKLAELPDAKVAELHKNGALGLIHAHQISMRHMRRLVEWRAARGAGAGAGAVTASA